MVEAATPYVPSPQLLAPLVVAGQAISHPISAEERVTRALPAVMVDLVRRRSLAPAMVSIAQVLSGERQTSVFEANLN